MKLLKSLLGLAAIGGAAAGIAYYLKKSDVEDDFLDEFEDEETEEREYVSLNPASKSEEAEEACEEEVEEEACEECAEEAEEEACEECAEEAEEEACEECTEEAEEEATESEEE